MTTGNLAHDGDDSTKSPPRRSLIQRIKDLPEDVKQHTKAILNHEDHQQVQGAKEQTDIFTDVAFNPSKHLDKPDSHDGSPVESSARDIAKKAVQATIHPRRTLREKATKTAAGVIGQAQQHYITLDHDMELLDAHDALANATNDSPSYAEHVQYEAIADKHPELANAREHVREIEEKRRSLQTAWILSRHVDRVRVVRPERKTRPTQAEFRVVDENGQERIAWERWLARLALFYSQPFSTRYVDHFEDPPFDLQDFVRTIERLAVTSAPWQAFLLDARKVYLWTNPWRTARYAALFCFLWYTEHIMGYFYGYVIYTTLRSRIRPTTVESVRESVQRSINQETRARAWSELIQQHGQSNWIEPLLDEVGPAIQLQLGDLADFLEVLVNFHRHERPDRTMATLFSFAVCLLITLVTDMTFCMELVWLTVGLSYFVSFPLATQYPRYRHLVTAVRWLFWDIPTHAELAITHLQEKAVMKMAEQMDTMDENLVEKSNGITYPRAESRQSSDVVSSPSSSASFDSALSSKTSLDIPDEAYSFSVCPVSKVGTKAHLIISTTGIEYRESKSFSLVSAAASGDILSSLVPSSLQSRTHDSQKNQLRNIKIPYLALHEMRKLELEMKREKVAATTMLHSTGSVNRIQFLYFPLSPSSSPDLETSFSARARMFADQVEPEQSSIQLLDLITSATTRDKIFNLVLGWSNLKWQSLRMERRRGVTVDATGDASSQTQRPLGGAGQADSTNDDDDNSKTSIDGDAEDKSLMDRYFEKQNLRRKKKDKKSGIGIDIHKSIKQALQAS